MKRKRTYHATLAIALLAAAWSSSGCLGRYLVYYDGPYRGYVVDGETGQPLEEAVVIIEYNMVNYLGLEGSWTQLLTAKETVTDKEGGFSFPRLVDFEFAPFSSLEKRTWRRLYVFSPGYECESGTFFGGGQGYFPETIRVEEGDIRRIAMTKAVTWEDRIESTSCYSSDMDLRKLPKFTNATKAYDDYIWAHEKELRGSHETR